MMQGPSTRIESDLGSLSSLLVKRMLYGLSNILKRETREGREESKTADQEGQRWICAMKWRKRGEIRLRQFSAAHH